MLIINIIAILLLAGGVFSSLPVQGSIPMIRDNMMLIDLHASESNVSDDLDELIEKLQGMEKPWVHLIINLGRKVIEINGEIDLKQDYFKAGSDIEDILRRVKLPMQERDSYYEKLTHQNSIDYEILRRVLQEYQDLMHLDKNNFALSWMLSNPEFALEMERFLSRNELSLEFAKSVQHAIFWLIKSFDMKWRQLHDDLDYISKWRLLNLQRQVELILDNLADNQRQRGESKDNKYIPEDRSDIISNTEETLKIEIEEETLTERNKGNLNEASKTKNNEDISWENTRSDYITSMEETQITNHPELLKRNKNDIKGKIPTTVKIPINRKFNVSGGNSIINSTLFSKMKTIKNKNFIKNETSLKSKTFIGTPHDKKDEELESVSSILPSGNAIDTLQKTDQPKPMGTDAMHGSLINVTDILKTRRTLLVPSSENKEYNKKNRQISAKEIADKHYHFNERMKIKSDRGSAIDEILEAVDEVLPTDRSVEMSTRGSETITRTL
ncbi:uncharacterized protein LOC143895954 isoform X1 [Temnothorax americanus]|uniref:uncharacterized protein LOC143895954 isoform X1 n=1 Tax=Temnothorax americanus TaxID=1964332 RepID=UPI004067CBC9